MMMLSNNPYFSLQIAREYTRRAISEFSELVLNKVLDASMVDLISEAGICVIDILVE